MAKKKIQFKSKERRDVKDTADFLRQLADKLESKEFILQVGKQETQLTIPNFVTLALKAQEKPTKGTTNHRLTISLAWSEDDQEAESVTQG